MSYGILGPYAQMIDRKEAPTLSTAELLQIVAPTKSDQMRVIDELERRWMLHYCIPWRTEQ